MAARPIPVTTIGGYLGAGKTTLVNAILAGSHGRRIGVLVNDFGAVSIDEKLIVARDGDVVALANGCACCSVAGDLGEALDRLAAANAPEHILIEASGVADPAKVAALARSPGLEPRAPVVLADAASVVARAEDKFVGKLVRRQLATAGLVVLTKVDVAGGDRLAAARRLVERAAPGAAIETATRGNIDPVLLLADGGARAGNAFDCSDGLPDAAFDSRYWSSDAQFDPQALLAVFAALPACVVRAKGVFSAADGVAYAVHRAGEQVELLRRDHAADARAHFVIIARQGAIDPAKIDAALQDCAATGFRS